MSDRQRDPFQVLGVASDADDDAIKKAYRRLAQQHHPDRNPDDASAEARFKEISQAYAVLSDPARRRAYAEFGSIAFDPNFDPTRARAAAHGAGAGAFFDASGGGASPFGDLGSLFEDLLGGRPPREPRRRRGGDLETTLQLDFVDAALGCEQRIELQRPNPDGPGTRTEKLTIHVPPGVADNGRIRLGGKGSPGSAGGPPGDLFARIRVRPHPLFRRLDSDVHLEASISVTEAVLGTDFEIPTLDGRVMLHVPAGTDSGSKLRLRGKGIPNRNASGAGDLYVNIRIRVPKDLSSDAKKQYADLAEHDPSNLRPELE